MTKPLDREDFDAICRLVCPQCGNGVEVVYRPETREYVHHRIMSASLSSRSYTQALCWASGLRNSDYAPKETDNAA